MTCFAGNTAANPSTHSAIALTVLGSSFGTKGSLAFLTNLATDSASQSLAGDPLGSLVTLQQVGSNVCGTVSLLSRPNQSLQDPISVWLTTHVAYLSVIVMLHLTAVQPIPRFFLTLLHMQVQNTFTSVWQSVLVHVYASAGGTDSYSS